MPIHLKLLLAAMIWGTTPTIWRVLSAYDAPFVVVCGRFVVASLFLLAFAAMSRQFVRIARHHWWRFLALGVTGIVLHNVLMLKSVEYTQATTVSIILALIAVQVVLIDWIFYRRRPDAWTLTGVVLAFVGAAWVLCEGRPATLLDMQLGAGELLAFLSGLAWAVYSVIGRELLTELSPLFVTMAASVIGVVMMLPFLAVQPEITLALLSDARAVGLIVFLGLLGSALGFLWYYEAVVHLGTVGAAVYINLVPIFGVMSAAVFLGEAVSTALIVGGVLVLAGLMLVNRPVPVAKEVLSG